MHFFYIDEAGCTGKNLQDPQQPVFVAGGLIVRDDGWNKTREMFGCLISDYFDGDVPDNFELHSHELLSPNGQGSFSGDDREKRITLVHNVLDLVSKRPPPSVLLRN